MVRRQRKHIELKLRLYPGQDDDLIAWLDSLDGQPFGAKAQAIRDVLHRGLGSGAESQPGVHAEIDLGDVRRVVEAAVSSALAQWECAGARASASGTGEDEETERILDGMSALAL